MYGLLAPVSMSDTKSLAYPSLSFPASRMHIFRHWPDVRDRAVPAFERREEFGFVHRDRCFRMVNNTLHFAAREFASAA